MKSIFSSDPENKVGGMERLYLQFILRQQKKKKLKKNNVQKQMYKPSLTFI